ncbi:MAG: maltose alpha-D-glucosyltransferase [Alphaproteobacteria bacterium]|nr:maltose alpha-D-glucosyltransferase [Alphaproteobacteria bacterium]
MPDVTARTTLPEARVQADAPDWYKDAIIYELHVKAFFDANNDGIGDLPGLIAKLDYLQDLGVTAIWLLPFFPSPFRDDGYDVSDYRNIHPAYGTLRDFGQLVREAHRRNLRIIVELVVNHTSDQHPWFQRARRARPGSVYRDYYVWSDTEEKYKGTRIIFNDTEKSNWTWDPVASAFYWHRFFAHQPDLNFDNPHVVRSVLNNMRFWADLGVDGFRLDAVPYLCEREGTSNENLPETHAVIKQMRSQLDREFPNRLFLAEANQWPEDVKDYFGSGDECHMAFHFPLMPRMYMAIAREDRHPITDIMRQTPEIPDSCQWAIFLRNHDELTLEMVTDSERDYLWSTYAADRRARLNLGIRRRLAPLMENDRRRIELMVSLLLSLPGTPILYYGDEIGMGDNIYLGDRDGVRTPMQWTPDRNAGFSRADPATLYLPPIMDAVYGFQALNVEAQSRSLSSLLNWMKRLIGVRKSLKVFGRGTLTFLYPSNRAVLAYLRQHEDVTVLCLSNLSRSAQAVELDLAGFAGRIPVELMGQTSFPMIGDGGFYTITLQGYGFYWFQLAVPVQGPLATVRTRDLDTLVAVGGLATVLEGRNRGIVERDILPPFLVEHRWFAQKSERAFTAALAWSTTFRLGDRDWLWLIADTRGRHSTARYSLPLTEEWQPPAMPPPTITLAKLRHGPREGYLTDALHNELFVDAVINAVREGRMLETAHGQLVFRPGATLSTQAWPEKPVIRIGSAEQSNSSAIVEGAAIIKFYRIVAPGVHPEIEVGTFLTERTEFKNAPPLLGHVALIEPDGQETALGVIHGWVQNQGDAWSSTLGYLARFLEESRVAPVVEPQASLAAHTVYHAQIEQLALRTAELHRAFNVGSSDPAFTVVPAAPTEITAWGDAIAQTVDDTFNKLTRGSDRLSGEAVTLAADLIGRREAIAAQARALADSDDDVLLSRLHGDYHLGQILVVKNDVQIVDFEGPPQLPLAERRRKHSVIRDVAGMLRSFDYAAWTALEHATTNQPDLRNDLLKAALLWRDDAINGFLDAYTRAMVGCPLWPGEENLARRLLKLFLIEKAALEITYELGNRPDWIAVPLRGLKALITP